MKKILFRASEGPLVLKSVQDVSVLKGSNIAEAFGTGSRTKRTVGIYDISRSEVTFTMETDNVLYILKGGW